MVISYSDGGRQAACGAPLSCRKVSEYPRNYRTSSPRAQPLGAKERASPSEAMPPKGVGAPPILSLSLPDGYPSRD